MARHSKLDLTQAVLPQGQAARQQRNWDENLDFIRDSSCPRSPILPDIQHFSISWAPWQN